MDLRSYALDDKFDLDKPDVLLNGPQALVRLCLMQAKRDRRAGLNTAGYVTGYRGSPLAGVDQQFARAEPWLKQARVFFEAALNEDLAATALWGSQQAELRGDGLYDGVFGLWYGKGPGVDRCGDVFRHGNYAGSSRYGGVLLVMGDDHTAESSSTCHQTEYALVDAFIPVLNPANLQEIIEYGLHGWALSRFSGLWCGLKCVKDTAESTITIHSSLDDINFVVPEPPDGIVGDLNIRRTDTPLAQEQRIHRRKISAAQSYVRVNGLDRVVLGDNHSRVGIITTGKSYTDVMQALGELGVGAAQASSLGIAVYKVAMPWPLEPFAARAFAAHLEKIIVIEEKRPLIEDQLKTLLYGAAEAPVIIGKRDEAGEVLFPPEGALTPNQIARVIETRLAARSRETTHLTSALSRFVREHNAPSAKQLEFQRTPYFCAGCPHSSSTVLPEGSRGYAGIGCHWMSQHMDRGVDGFSHMGGEGASWIGERHFSRRKHVFQSLGDGTYNHSGLLALRAAIDAKANITYKILFNDAVAMTGGQPHEGGLSVLDILAEVSAAGVQRLALVSDHPEAYASVKLPAGVEIRHRDGLMILQRAFADVPGVTVIVYEQTCAAEKRRRRKRGTMPDIPQRVLINAEVCEGCGDCGVQSNCVAILPLETELGRKRQIDQSACNKDFSCLKGFCPSFVTVADAELRPPSVVLSDIGAIPEPANKMILEREIAIVLTGIGGTGVVTVGAILAVAAHLEGRGCGVIDMQGLAQKGGAVVSHIKLAPQPADINAIRVSPGRADVLIGCDLVVSATPGVIETLDPGRSHAVVNSHQVMPGDFTRKPDLLFPASALKSRLRAVTSADALTFVDATEEANGCLGNSIGSNLLLLGVAYQQGLIPLSADAIEAAVRLNGTSVGLNLKAFGLGRVWAQRSRMDALTGRPTTVLKPLTLAETIADRVERLTKWQDLRHAQRYRDLVTAVSDRDLDPDKRLTWAVAQNAAKLMSYKDEYEVARLYTDGNFAAALSAQFQSYSTLKVHLAPPLLSRPDPRTGRPRKRAFGKYILPTFGFLARCKGLRGTPFDIFGYTRERRIERRLMEQYLDDISTLVQSSRQIDPSIAIDLANLPSIIRGFGPVKLASIEIYDERRTSLITRIGSGSFTGTK